MLIITQLESLNQTAYDNDIAVWNAHFSPTQKAVCLSSERDNIVLDINKMDSTAEETEILAHEITHIKSGSVFFITAAINTPLECVNHLKYEADTKRETILALLPPEKL